MSQRNSFSKKLVSSLKIGAYAVAIIWVVHLAFFLLGMNVGYYGIFPMRVYGLKGILFAPLLHANFPHLISNTVPLFVLMAMVYFFYRKIATKSLILIYLLSGSAVWLIAQSGPHVGASGVIYGLVALVFWLGLFRRNVRSIALSLIVLFYYGSLFLGILPGQEGISWEGHLFGALSGILAAYLFRRDLEDGEDNNPYSSLDDEERNSLPRNFLNQDIFEKTKAERERERHDPEHGGWFSTKTWE